MTARWIAGVLAVAALTLGMVFQVLWLTVSGLVVLLAIVVVRAGRSPLAETYRDVPDPRIERETP